jgi:dihydroxyacid dehydratase/phosphogluconate dehydratase
MKKWAVLAVALMACAAWATPGGVDDKGCHKSEKIGFHCHAQKVKTSGPGGSAESKGDRAARLRKECRGLPNTGACTGYGTR